MTLAEYQALDGNSSKTQTDYDATWANTTFKMEGAVTEDKAVTATTTAPTLTVTWSWVDPDATPANVAPTIASGSKEVALEAGSPLEVSINPGSGDYAATGIKSITLANGNTIPAARYTYADSTLTFDTTFVTNNRNAIGIGNSMEVTVTFTCDDETDRTDTFTFTVD